MDLEYDGLIGNLDPLKCLGSVKTTLDVVAFWVVLGIGRLFLLSDCTNRQTKADQ